MGVGMDLKLQSAMEYLMTYGWAILIIAVVMVALYSLGVFGTSGGVSTCLPQSGFMCSQMLFSANTLNSYSDPSITATVGDAFSGQWTQVYFVVVPQGQTVTDTSMGDLTNPDDFWYWGYYYGTAYGPVSMSPGQLVNAKMYISPEYPWLGNSKITIGSKFTGSIWVMYDVQGSSTPLLSEVGTFTATAVSQ